MSPDPRTGSLERRLAAVEAALVSLRGSNAVSSNYGGLDIRTPQVGFAAELTSTYDTVNTPSHGYSWKRRFLDLTTPGFTNQQPQLTGSFAFAPDGNQGLTSGTEVWLEPSPDASGWVIVSPPANWCGDHYTFDTTATPTGAIGFVNVPSPPHVVCQTITLIPAGTPVLIDAGIIAFVAQALPLVPGSAWSARSLVALVTVDAANPPNITGYVAGPVRTSAYGVNNVYGGSPGEQYFYGNAIDDIAHQFVARRELPAAVSAYRIAWAVWGEYPGADPANTTILVGSVGGGETWVSWRPNTPCYPAAPITCTGSGSGPPAAGCNTCTLLGLTPSLAVPDGPYAGGSPYAGTAWAIDAFGQTYSDFTVAGLGFCRCYCDAAGTLTLTGSGGSHGTVTTCGPPVVFTFPGAAMSATGSCTVTT